MNQITTTAGASREPFNYSKIEQVDRDNVTPWLDIADVRDQLNLYGDTSQDDYISMLELASRQFIEDYLGMSIFPITYRVYYDQANISNSPVALDLPAVSQNLYPSQSGVTVKAIKYWNSANVLTTVAASNYYFDQSGNKVVLLSLPNDMNNNRTAPLYCEYTAVSNPLSAYPVIKQAALLLITHWYNVRAQTTEKIMREIPFGFHTILRPYKPLVL